MDRLSSLFSFPIPGGAVAVSVPPVVDPRKNPSYPQRVHVHERARWQGVLLQCDERIAAARAKLGGLAQGSKRAAFERLFAQMLGACDQVAEAARRLPTETGELYKEDRHRLEEAVAALERVWQRWESMPS
jgi:hypothetical protein